MNEELIKINEKMILDYLHENNYSATSNEFSRRIKGEEENPIPLMINKNCIQEAIELLKHDNRNDIAFEKMTDEIQYELQRLLYSKLYCDMIISGNKKEAMEFLRKTLSPLLISNDSKVIEVKDESISRNTRSHNSNIDELYKKSIEGKSERPKSIGKTIIKNSLFATIDQKDIIPMFSGLLFQPTPEVYIKNHFLLNKLNDLKFLSNEALRILNLTKDKSDFQRPNLMQMIMTDIKFQNEILSNNISTLPSRIEQENLSIKIPNQYHNNNKVLYTLDKEFILSDSNTEDYPLTIHHFKQEIKIEKNTDEIWIIEFAKSKELFATVGRNSIINVFRFHTLKHQITCVSNFCASKKYITSLAFTDSETSILITSIDNLVKHYNLEGLLLKSFCNHSDIVSSVKSLGEGLFLTGGIDKKIILQDINDENKFYVHSELVRVRDILIGKFNDTKYFLKKIDCLIIVPASKNEIIIYSYKIINEDQLKLDLSPINKIDVSDCIISTYLNLDYFVVNTGKVHASINVYNIKEGFNIINKYYGHKQTQFVVGVTMNNSYLFSGSEDFMVYIWHLRCSHPLFVIQASTGCVNSLFVPFFGILFTVSDDHTLRVFSSEKIAYIDSSGEIKRRVNSVNSIRRVQLDEMSEDDSVDDVESYGIVDENVGFIDQELSEGMSLEEEEFN